MKTIKEFVSEPYIDFSLEENKNALTNAVEKVTREMGKTYPLIIDGKEIFEGEVLASTNPAHTREVVGTVHLATQEHAEMALVSAWDTFDSWRLVDSSKRADILFKAADLARSRKLELSVWLSKENGKSIRESVAEVAEGIDFLDFYARRMNEISSEHGVLDVAGEKNYLVHLPLGAGIVISPWNFGFAILAGLAAGPIVCGNTVVVKPASTTPIVAHKFYSLMKEAGLPAGVMNLISAQGSVVGNYLVEHPRTRFINFTGSTDVGTGIYEKASKVAPTQKWFKRVIMETGGKNHIIVCADTDVRKAAEGVVKSAFGYSGQKCSACSVVVVEESVHDSFVKELVAFSRNLVLGDGTNPSVYTGPVIDQSAEKKILHYIDQGKKDGTLAFGGSKLSGAPYDHGCFISPTIFTHLKAESRLLYDEIFGPVLSVVSFKTFDEALAKANSTAYGLTGGIYTNDAAKKERARKEFHVGNLYINKFTGGSTGAMVGRQPFGGFNMSGTDSKAGGKSYLHLFLQEKSIADMS